MRTKILMPAILTGLLALTACGHKKDQNRDDRKGKDLAAMVAEPVSDEGLEAITSSWPIPSREAITAMKEKYGRPASISEDSVVWTKTAPFQRTVVFKEQINHLLPIQHSDVLMQTIAYRVPLNKVSRLAEFNGSLIVDRTKGTLSSRNDREAMNFLALNLADKIVKGQITVEQARRDYKSNAEQIMAGKSNELVSRLRFKSDGNTSDPDTLMQSQESGEEE